ncbi:MAG TPA: CDP-glycerol glycerophosphotransferase family protein [Xanthomonadaceae bacterium]|nr:CDP-glycerol glycerophosphotransferase family protein [Xanthomonadaceae bacterium]
MDLVVALCGWAFLAPLTFLWPRDPRRVVFFGRDGGKFIDNCKHFFAAVHDFTDGGVHAVYIAKDESLRSRLADLGANAVRHQSLAAWWNWLRAGVIVVDSIDWCRQGRFPAARGARLIQLWHGVPLKHVQLALLQPRLQRLPRPFAWLLSLQRSVTGRFAMSDVFLSTSPFVTEHAFSASFRYRKVSHAGYPRNDVLLRPGNPLAELGVDSVAQHRVRMHRNSGRGLVGLYAPTFRNSFADPFASGAMGLEILSSTAVAFDMLLLVKLHPWMLGKSRKRDLPGLHFVEPDSDAYPLMRDVDFLITDYSSIFFDFLLLNRPVVFFPYDLDQYLASERSMYFDYASMTPGPKATTIEELARILEAVHTSEDTWEAERRRVRSLVFSHVDGNSGERLAIQLFPCLSNSSSGRDRDDDEE